jgi:hypothetical protein
MPTSPDVISPIMAAVLACGQTALETYDRKVGRAGLVFGDLAVADECCDGYLYVRLVTMYPSGNPFPSQDLRPGNCKPTLMASQLALGIFRCIPTIEDGAELPSAEELNTATLGITADASILLSAMKCCVDPDSIENLERVVLGAWTPKPNLGGCGGGEWALTVGHGTCACPEA